MHISFFSMDVKVILEQNLFFILFNIFMLLKVQKMRN